MTRKVTAPGLAQMKAKGERIVALTAYDCTSANLAEEAGVDFVLVGDSLGNVVQGLQTTLPVSMADMLYHVGIVKRFVSRALLVVDMPFGSSQVSVEKTLDNAVALMKAGAEAVKIEGDEPDKFRALLKAGIPVVGHLGFTPQSVNAFGGHRIQGKNGEGESIKEAALRLEDAGASSVVLELMPSQVAAEISSLLKIPTIGIGAGAGCDGQIQVFHDIVGLAVPTHKHAKAFVEGYRLFSEATRQYCDEVRQGSFPGKEQSF